MFVLELLCLCVSWSWRKESRERVGMFLKWICELSSSTKSGWVYWDSHSLFQFLISFLLLNLNSSTSNAYRLILCTTKKRVDYTTLTYSNTSRLRFFVLNIKIFLWLRLTLLQGIFLYIQQLYQQQNRYWLWVTWLYLQKGGFLSVFRDSAKLSSSSSYIVLEILCKLELYY